MGVRGLGLVSFFFMRVALFVAHDDLETTICSLLDLRYLTYSEGELVRWSVNGSLLIVQHQKVIDVYSTVNTLLV